MKKSYTSIGGISCVLMLTVAGASFHAQVQSNSDTISRKNTPEATVLRKKTDTLSPSNKPLSEKVSSIEEVVLNAGYYKVKDREFTGSIAKVSAKDIENQPVSNVLSAVQGRVSGVNITQNSGVPGGGFDIQIRGKNSLRREGNDPMYIVDGVVISSENPSRYSSSIMPYSSISPLNSINPNDIENIEILKDADATAIYGSRGANGVVLITTKKGKKGRTQLSINTSYALSRAASKMKMMNTEEYISMRKEAYANDGITTYPATAYDVNGAWNQSRYTDWQKALIGNTAETVSTQVSVSGGSEGTSFLISGSHQEQTTVFPASFRYKTNNITSSISHQSKDRKFTANLSNLISFQTNNILNQEITNKSIFLSPNAPALYTANGSVNWENNTFDNPIAPFVSTYSNDSKQFTYNVNMSYEAYKGISVKLNGGINYRAFEEYSLLPHTMYNPSYGLTSATSSALRNRRQYFSYIIEPQLGWKHTFGDHQVDVLAGGTFQQDSGYQSQNQGYGFESNALIHNIGAAKTKIITEADNEYRYAALFGRINYQYKHKYILNITGRRDGSSRFGPQKRFANFGAVGAAWLFSNEHFLKEAQWLSYGKFRSSVGTTGSDKIGDYQYLDTYTVSGTGYGGITALNPSRLYNPLFSWEKTVKLEAAIELGFLKDRINLSAALYRNRSSNQLVGVPLPGTTGFSSIQANLPATVENKGFEFDLSAFPVRTSHFKWNTSFNISIPTSKLVSFPGLQGSTYANQYVIGYPVSIVKVYQYEGIDPGTGLYRFKDFNGDGKITSPDDNQMVERVGVRYFGGLQNQLQYKNWTFSFLLQFVKQRNWNYHNYMPTPGTMNNQPVELLDVWSQDNPGGSYMPYTSGADPQKTTLQTFFKNSTAAISDASFIRLKNIQLSYRLKPESGIVKDAMIYFQGQNLLTWTKYFGLDPEFVLTGFLPPLKTYSFGIQLNF
ncbi:SusC/RagA family TonB-linked outer membrane protein [Chryseobacterium sp.]|uniref:SusC/RagA family TonB-linked outer membrane protein n=1 Tax=Chryseobacterium sp. TaxID=1871047 RepID=UPI0025C71F1B|nr:SusC/RagA family TonB-linked outer membrane protein [Chryseobacterium sp.]